MVKLARNLAQAIARTQALQVNLLLPGSYG